MIDREEMTDVAFEMLKLLFFVVAYFLMASEVGTDGVGVEKRITETAAFYNTLFIFSATTWIDYLSSMKDSIREGYSYNGKYTLRRRHYGYHPLLTYLKKNLFLW